MKAIVLTNYGAPDVLQLQEIAKPTPKEGEVLIKVRATTVTAGDGEIRNLKFSIWLAIPIRLWLGFIKPRDGIILGQELAGEVVAVGKNVRKFNVGDQVFGGTGLHFGAYAEYVCLPESEVLATKPVNMTYEQAAAVPTGGFEAVHFLRKAAIQSGEKILINGAGGSIGTFAVQLAKHFGAEVTAVDSAAKLTMLRSIGADKVIDYTQEDFTQNGQTYDIIFDVIGKSPFSRSLASLKQKGRYLIGNFSLSQMSRGLWASMTSSKKVIIGAAHQNLEDLIFLKNLIEAGELKSVIDRQYPLAQVAEAHRYVDTGQKIGSVVITVEHDDIP